MKHCKTTWIVLMLALICVPATAWAQQNPDDAKKAEDAKRADEARKDDAQKLGDAVRAQVEQRQIRIAIEEQRARAAAQATEAEANLRMARDRVAVDRDQAAAMRQWTTLQPAPRATKKEKVTYCGVSTSEAPQVLIEQLKLTKGIGLVVDFVEPGSPAESAGVKQYDILTKFNDQIISNSEQLGVLVRLKKQSDDAKLSLIRQGQPLAVNVELGQREIEVEVEQAAVDMNTGRRATMMGNGQLTMTTPRVFGYHGGGAMVGGGGGGMAITNINGRNQSVWSDDQNTLTLELKDGKATTLRATDNTGKELFNGPVETDEQRKALPAELGEKLKKAEAGRPLQLGGYRVATANARPRVLTSTEKDTLMLARFENGKVKHVFAFSTADGKTLFDGPVADDAQRKAMPEDVAKQLEQLEKNQAAAGEFGVVGRN